MIRLFKYNLNSEFEGNKESLNQLDNYVALTEDNQMVHLKPLQNIFYVTTNNTNTTIYKWTDNSYEIVTLNNGENKLTDWNYGFYFSTNNMRQFQITSFDFSKYDTSNVTNMNYMFKGCKNLTSLNVSKFNTANVTDMAYMFSDCNKLTSLDLSSFNTSKVTYMSYMFYQCSGLTSLDLSNFNTANVTDMGGMFRSCNKLTHIKCKQTFKDWCWTNQDTIKLPTAMRNGGGGTWEIVQ